MRVLRYHFGVLYLFGTRVESWPKKKNDVPKKIFLRSGARKGTWALIQTHKHFDVSNSRLLIPLQETQPNNNKYDNGGC
jgi:hypothetical protein